MPLPIESVDDGYKFQQIVAEYFRCLKSERLDYQISDIHVDDNGIGGDDGCDIVVEFEFQDVISRHSHKWVVECKSQKNAVGINDIKTNNLESILKANKASGYLLVCKNDATASLKRIFKELSLNSSHQYKVWNGTQLWHHIIQHKSLILAFFPEYHSDNFLRNKAEETFGNLVKQFEEKLNSEKNK